ncbi:MAG TPA: CDP-diacylglycerol--serine O-phosphatidyltransferase [Candidatus Riflebacteria bacterium]|jgi:CDP-diacylglycerol--serine O-phosphatidyltransferase|nr:CDP-diacylglycerol--serine O-phosphatidyltransferase [Candidatus Riflebacteria bacterium]
MTTSEEVRNIQASEAQPAEITTATTEGGEKPRRRFNSKHLSILPNACTSMNLICGYLSIVMTSQGEFLSAGWLILLANIFDILDGRLARLTSVESRFGAELDSLADLVSFGVSPAFLVYTRYLSHDRFFGLIISSIFVICGALRLARFNVTPHSKQDVFVGLPIPAGAGIIATMTIFELQFFNFMRIPAIVIPFVVAITSFLMVSTIEYPAMKKTPQTSGKRKLVVALLLLALVVNPPMTLFFLTWGFALYGLTFSLLRNTVSLLRRLRKKPQSETHE